MSRSRENSVHRTPSLPHTAYVQKQIVFPTRPVFQQIITKPLVSTNGGNKTPILRDLTSHPTPPRLLQKENAQVAQPDDAAKQQMTEIEQLRAKNAMLEQQKSQLEEALKGAHSELIAEQQEVRRLELCVQEKAQEAHAAAGSAETLQIQVKNLKWLEEEHTRMQQSLENKQREVDEVNTQATFLKARVEQLQSENGLFQKSISDLRAQLQDVGKQQIETVKRYDALQQRQKENYEYEIAQQKAAFQDATAELEKCKKENSDQSYALQESEGQLRNYEDKLMRLTQEIENLSNFLKQKADEMEKLRNRNFELESKLQIAADVESDARRVREQLEQKISEVHLYREKQGKLQAEIDSLLQSTIKLGEFESKVLIQQTELDRLNDTLAIKSKELEDLRQKNALKNLQATEMTLLQQQFQDQQAKLALLAEECERLNKLVFAKSEEYSTLKREYNTLELQLRDAQQFQYEVDRLKSIIERKMRDIEDYRARQAEYENSTLEVQRMQLVIEESEQRNHSLQRDVMRLEDVIATKTGEIEDLRKKTEVLEYRLNTQDINESEITRLTKLHQERLREIEDLRNKYSAQYQECLKLKHDVEDRDSTLKVQADDNKKLKALLDQLNVQIQALRQAASTSEKTLLDTKRTAERCYTLEKKVSVLEADLQTSKSQQTLAQDEISALKRENAQLQGQVRMQGIEERRLKESVTAKRSEIDQYAQKVQEQEQRIYELKKLESANQDLQVRSQYLDEELQRRNKIINDKNYEIEKLQTQLSELADSEDRVRLLSDEIERLENENRALKREGEQTCFKTAEFAANDERYNRLLSQFVISNSNVEALQRRVQQLEAEKEEMKYGVSTFGNGIYK